jgi:LacI family transcriptional regulator
MTEKQAITIHDIAAKAGVSPSTVSRVLNGTTPVHPEKRRVVLEAIADLHYRPNIAAQGLARGRSRAVGVLTQDITSPFYGQILRGVEGALRGTGYYPIFASGALEEEAAEALQLLMDNRVGSLIVVGGQTLDQELADIANQVPVIVVGRLIAGLEGRCLQVANYDGAIDAMRYLLKLGHRRIAHITGVRGHRHASDRLAGYEKALTEAGIEVDSALIVEGNFEEESGRQAIETLLAGRVPLTAVFASNDQMAYGALSALFAHGLGVPRDVSLIGFDDQTLSAYTTPAMTTMRQPTVEMGRCAVRALLDLVREQPFDLPIFCTELVERQSTGPAPPAIAFAS